MFPTQGLVAGPGQGGRGRGSPHRTSVPGGLAAARHRAQGGGGGGILQQASKSRRSSSSSSSGVPTSHVCTTGTVRPAGAGCPALSLRMHSSPGLPASWPGSMMCSTVSRGGPLCMHKYTCPGLVYVRNHEHVHLLYPLRSLRTVCMPLAPRIYLLVQLIFCQRCVRVRQAFQPPGRHQVPRMPQGGVPPVEL